MESMTNAPHLLPGARAGYRIGDGAIVDSMMYDGLYCAFDQCAMGEGTEKYSQAHGLEREHMDAMAAESHRRADAAQAAGRFDDEIVPSPSPAQGRRAHRRPRRGRAGRDHHRVPRRPAPGLRP
jgi:acetyl-CoA C-acetyltransferase